jgi:hypothetical protein
MKPCGSISGWRWKTLLRVAKRESRRFGFSPVHGGLPLCRGRCELDRGDAHASAVHDSAVVGVQE